MPRHGSSIGALVAVLLLAGVIPATAMTTVPGRPAAATVVASWSNWETLAPGMTWTQRPVATSWGAGRLDVVAPASDSWVYDVWYDSSGWHPTRVGNPTPSELAAVTNPSYPGRLDLYERTFDTDHALSADHYNTSSAGNPWTGFATCIGGHLASEPSGIMWNGAADAFVEGSDHQLWEWSMSGLNLCGSWQPAIGGRLSAAPAAVGTGLNEDVVFVRGTDLALWWWSSLTGWHSAGGRLADKPAAVAPGNGPPVAFVQGTDGALWSFETSTESWHLVGGKILGVPSPVVSAQTGALPIDVFVEGVDHAVWHAHFDGTSWFWENLRGSVTSAPSAVSWSAGRFDVFARGADGTLRHIFYR